MSKKIVVPEGMLKAAVDAFMLLWEKQNGAYRHSAMGRKAEEDSRMDYQQALEAALLWLSKNPIGPTDEFLAEMLKRDFFGGGSWTDPQVFKFCTEWQRRMFRAPEPEVPEIADLLKDLRRDGDAYHLVIEAYRRGQESKMANSK